jgi:hypothetical protein
MWRRIAVVMFVVAATSGGPVQASKRPIMPTMGDLATTWWGQLHGGTFMLLELDSTGTGMLVLHSVWSTSNPVAYRVRSTSLARYDIAFVLEAVDGAAKDVALRGHAYRGALDLRIGARSLQWKDDVELRPWSTVMAANDALTRRRDQLRDPTDGR